MKKKFKTICLITLFLVIMFLNTIYLFKIDVVYSTRFHELINEGEISDFDEYFSSETKIYYNDEYIYYVEARKNIIEYINKGERLYCNSYGYDHNKYWIIGDLKIRLTTPAERVLDLKYWKGIFFIKTISLRIDSAPELYPIFFGENE